MSSTPFMGRYQLLECIGAGTMGVVWRCFDQDLEEMVAIKFLRGDVARDEALRASFRRGVKLSRRITHPNVARVFELGRDGETYFLTMEYIVGESLRARLARPGRAPPEQLPGLAVSLCRGLAAAHAVDVVHGDLKPESVLITPHRGAVLTDFGLARAFVADGEHLVEGSPYLAPERRRGGPPTRAADVFAAGVVLVELLAGSLPTHVESALPGLPDALAALLRDCLQDDPQRRPPDARALLGRLADTHAPAPAFTGEATAAPDSGDGPHWLEILPFDLDVETSAWVTDDLVHALAQVPGLRVALPAATAPALAPTRTQIRGEVRTSAAGVVVTVQIVEPGQGTPRAGFELRETGADLHNLGVDLATRIVAAIEPRQAAQLPARHDDLDAVTADLYVRARTAELAMRPAEAIRLYEAALERAPGHRGLRLGHVLARIHATFLIREPNPAEIAEVSALARTAVAEHPDLGDTHLAIAGLGLCVNDTVACARSLRLALRHAPGLMAAHAMVADLLTDIGRLPDAERHLDIAAALHQDSLQVCLYRARLFACQGRWDDYYGLLTGKLSRLRFRTAASLRMALWRPDGAILAGLAQALVDDPDPLPAPLQADARDVVAFARGSEDRRAIRERFAAAHPLTGNSRYARIFAQMQAEMACMTGDLEHARACLGFADGCSLIDWHWICQCPNLTPLHGDPQFMALRARVQARADAVADALWTGEP
jgi:tetratricopeptide (TPR) repeat protein